MRITMFLKRVLLLDAASCLGMGAGLLIGATALAAPLGLSAALLGGAGLLLPLGLFIGWLGLRAEAPAALVWLVILGNLGWVGESLLVAFGRAGVSGLGIAFVTVQAAAVLGLALLEYAGLRAARATA